MTNDSKTTERDDLAETLNDAVEVFYEPFDWHEATRIAARILAAGYRKPRTITTAEELDASPIGLIVRDGDREPWERTDNGWNCWVYGGQSFASRDLVLPATVLYEPESEATR